MVRSSNVTHMKIFENKILQSKLIYSSQVSDAAFRTWTLKKTKCKILLYEDELCSDLERIICSTLNFHEDIMKLDELATILGFNVKDNFTSTPKRYKDDAEVNIFDTLLKIIEKEELVTITDGIVALTSLGKFSVSTGKKRVFYEAECQYLENFNISTYTDVVFPFKEALNITTTLNNKKRVSYYNTLKEYNIEPQVKEDEKTLVDNLLAQMLGTVNIFSAILYNCDFTIESESIPIAIYNDNGIDFVVVYSKNGFISEYASLLLNDEINTNIKAIKVEWGYYLRLLNDSTASLDYISLKPFEDIIEWKKIISDKRFCWNDRLLFQMMSKQIDANIWHDISSICPTEDIKSYLNDSSYSWDWSILSARLDGKYIREHAAAYSWDFDIIIHNPNVSTEDIEDLLLNPYLTSVQWPWKEIMPSLSDAFVIKHIDDVGFDLTIITEKEPELVKKLIIEHPDKDWDWGCVSNSYDLEFILENIKLLYRRINLQSVALRALSSNLYANKYCNSQIFKKCLKDTVGQPFSTINFNSSNLIWNNDTIEFLEDVGALTWCVPIVGGFERNPNINWDRNFFCAYSDRISSSSGYSYVTSRVTDLQIVNNHPLFNWDWEIISSKEDWIKDTSFVERHISNLNLDKSFELFSTDTFCALFDHPKIQSYLSSHLDKLVKATELASIQLVKEHINFDWDWNCLTIKTLNTLKVERLGDRRWVNKWNWTYLSENLSVNDIAIYLFRYEDYWNWDILTKRLSRDIILANLEDFADKWNWSILISDIFTLEDLRLDGHLPTIATIISLKGDETTESLWKSITRRFSLEDLYLQIHQSLALSNYASLFQWDLTYVYDHKEFNLNDYINSYPNDVNWELLSKSKSAERLFFYDKTILSFKMWLDMVKSLLHNNTYSWDFAALSRNESINWHPLILRVRKQQWDWQYLSQNSKCFSCNSGSKDQTNLSKNIKQFKDELDFQLLSVRNDIFFNDELLSEFNNENWNWAAISSSDKLLVSNEFLIEHQDKGWDWDCLSKSERLTIDKELLDRTKHQAWNWSALSSNKSLKISLSDLLALDITGWNWNEICARKDIAFDNDAIRITLNKSFISWDWALLSSRTDLNYDESFILDIWQKPLDWMIVSRMSTFTPTINVLSKISSFDLDWNAISQSKLLKQDVLYPYKEKLNWKYISQSETFQKLGIEFYRKYRQYLDWAIIANSPEFILSVDNLKEFRYELDWNIINNRSDLQYSNIILDEFADYIDWSKASQSKTIEFSIDFVRKHADRWDWFKLVDNPLIMEYYDQYESAFKEKFNAIKFIKRFSLSNPKVYHFAHLFNAVNIIKSRRILSRIGGKGLFENSAGSNVHRRDTAHHFARFYYRPQTPTQYYNEALGEDSHTSRVKWVFGGYDAFGKKIWDSYNECPTSKYIGAQRLGAPKCPMPVFFEFDLREILNYCLDKCYYSTGNMQCDNSQVVSIIDNPNRLNTSALYSTIDDGMELYKAFSQQEFLVLNELDFSDLKDFRIICYNDEQADLLRMQLGNDPICEHISTHSSTSSGINIYHRTNKTISIDETDETIRFSTNYKDPSCIVIECSDINDLEVLDKSHITDISDGKISAYPTISFVKPSTPITVRFVDLKKFDGNSWIIYSTKGVEPETLMKYSILTKQLLQQFEMHTSKLKIELSKSMFKEHMLNSYHGIGHTARVMWNAFVIASLDKDICESMITSILYAALIHDLGKRNDTEGEIHGQNSVILYKTIIERLCSQNDARLILEAVKYHSVDDSKTPSMVRDNKIWEILKDADALDRSRLPGKGCNPSFLRNPIFLTDDGKELLSLAKELPILTIGCSWDFPVVDILAVLKEVINI